MLRDCMGIINIDENETDMRGMTAYRSVGTIPIAGRYRLIDFILSDMVNAGIKNISVFSSKETRSLSDHLGNGKSWDLDRKSGGLFLFNHNLLDGNSTNNTKNFSGIIDFFNNNIAETIVFASSNMIVNIDIEKYVTTHIKNNSDISIIYKKVNNARTEFVNCDNLILSENNNVISISKNIGIIDTAEISTDIYIFSKKILTELMYEGISKGFSSLKSVIKNNLVKYNVTALEFEGYLKCVNSTLSYYNASLEMLDYKTTKALFNTKLPIYTKTNDSPPVKYLDKCNIKNAMIADGCIICGSIINSVINRNVRIEEGAAVDGCIILQNATIKKGAKLKNVIVDKGVTISENAVIQCPKNYPLVFERNLAI